MRSSRYLAVFGSLLYIAAGDRLFAVSQFMSLPFNDPGVHVSQGWLYSEPTPEVCSHQNDPNYPFCHYGIDYSRGGSPFSVLAVADGEARFTACRGACNKDFGNYVMTRHAVQGITYYTLSAHLSSSTLPDGNKWTPVARGQKLGVAGDTGIAQGIHLHFQAYLNGTNRQDRVDPYDIANSREHYPSGSLFAGCGTNLLWTACPPVIAPNSYTFKLDSFEVTRNGTPLFGDNFDDGLAPPSGAPVGYSMIGSMGPEANGKLIIDSPTARVVGSIPPGDRFFLQEAVAQSGRDVFESPYVLSSADSFSVTAIFDLIQPEGLNEDFGIRLDDGEDELRLSVERILNSQPRIRYIRINDHTPPIVGLGSAALSLDHSQIFLTLSRPTAFHGISASFGYVDNGVVGTVTTLSGVGGLFQNSDTVLASFSAASMLPRPESPNTTAKALTAPPTWLLAGPGLR